LTVMKEAFKVFDLLKVMTEKGNPNSVTDGAVGVLAVRACIRGAFLNVKINVKGLKDREKAADLVAEAQFIDDAATTMENEIIARVSSQLAV
ncbi:glutamate formimidoyltransferase, partial [bacterium]|nr:glutamate formimidoyltransferase [bacterium]